MSGFGSGWLDLRAPADARARDGETLEAAAAWLDARDDPRVFDLGCGTGATYRVLKPALTRSARWTLVDSDRALLDEAARRTRPDVETLCRDVSDLSAFEIPPDSLITCSALLDLVTRSWIAAIADIATQRGCALYTALDVSGDPVLSPAHPDDGAVFDAFARHQETDKGFGPALGPNAPAETERIFRAAGYRIRSGASDWRLESSGDGGLLAALVDGWADAARDLAPGFDQRIEQWRRERKRAVEAGTLRAVVPHRDTFAKPPS